MKVYLGQCEYKWTHVESRMEQLWIQRELGEELFKEINHLGLDIILERQKASFAPDIYCTSKIYVELDDTKRATLFLLKWKNYSTLNNQNGTEEISLYVQ